MRHASGAYVYAAAAAPGRGFDGGADDVIELVAGLRQVHAVTISTPASVPAAGVALLGLADRSVLVLAPEIPAARA